MSTGSLLAALDGAHALLLDVDDTIVDTQEAMVVAGNEAAAAIWPHQGAEHRAMAQRYYDDPERWFPRYAPSGDVAFDAMRAGRLAEVAGAFGLEIPSGAHRAFEEAYAPAFRGAQRLFPDVPGLLAAAEGQGLPVALLTNSAHAPTGVKLEALDLVERFDVVVTTDTLGFGKPDPRIYPRRADSRVPSPAGWSASVTTSSGTSSAHRRRDGAPCGSTVRDAGPPSRSRRCAGWTRSLRCSTADLGHRARTGSIPIRFTPYRS